MQDDIPLTHDTEEAILKSLTDAVFEANHLSAQFQTEEEKKLYNHYAATVGGHALMRDLALNVDTPIEHQIQLVRKIHQEIDSGAVKALEKADLTVQDLLNEQLLKMNDLPASMRVLGDLSALPEQYKNQLVYSLIGYFSASATKGEYQRPILALKQLALLKGQDLSILLDQNPDIVTSLRSQQTLIGTDAATQFEQFLKEQIAA